MKTIENMIEIEVDEDIDPVRYRLSLLDWDGVDIEVMDRKVLIGWLPLIEFTKEFFLLFTLGGGLERIH